MIELTELQRDALGEIFNIGVGRAASGLSQMVNETVKLSAPSVTVCAIDDVGRILIGTEFDEVSAVSQEFHGPFETVAMLVFPESQALEIVRMMIGSSELSAEEISEYEQESMCEIGNIILNACISALADNFGVVISGGLPVHHFRNPEKLILFGLNGEQTDSYVLLLKVSMSISKKCINGHIVFLMSIKSLSTLLGYVDRYLNAQGLL
jgi:chemotaxis protein CheC